MIPIFWRFLISQYLKVTGLCVVAFIAVLLTTRLNEIAHFASLSPSISIIVLFILYQIPYILPIVIPIACLISSILLIQRLSKTHELTAFRSCGMAIKDFLTPILFTALILSAVDFYIVSELATSTHLQTSLWKEQLRGVNPLLLLRNKHLLKVKGGYFDTMGPSRPGVTAEQVVFALPNTNEQRISLFIAEQLSTKESSLKGKNVSLITTLAGKDPESFDQLVIENIKETETQTDSFSQIMQHNVWNASNDHLRMNLLLARLHEEKVKNNTSIVNMCYSEIIRRFSVAFAAFTFTLMGASFGISISRNQSVKNIFYVILLAGLYLITFFVAKGMEKNIIYTSLLHTVPQLIIIIFSIIVLRRASLGIEKG